MDAVEHILRTPVTTLVQAVADLGTWREHLARCPYDTPIDRALWAGFEADRLGYAFVGGYQAALARLLAANPSALSAPIARSLAATEAGGGHPRAITTTLHEEEGTLRLRGVKTFATLASIAEEILVVASRGQDAGGRNRLALVRVRAGAPGLTIEGRPPTPFAPEIPHAKLTLEGVAVKQEDILPGDGYDDYLKPFRTIEDVHVLAATIGYLVRVARDHAFSPSMTARLAALALAVRTVAERAPSDPVTHVVLVGLFGGLQSLLAEHESEWLKASADVRDRWQRDRGLLLVAESVRQARTATAWRALFIAES